MWWVLRASDTLKRVSRMHMTLTLQNLNIKPMSTSKTMLAGKKIMHPQLSLSHTHNTHTWLLNINAYTKRQRGEGEGVRGLGGGGGPSGQMKGTVT